MTASIHKLQAKRDRLRARLGRSDEPKDAVLDGIRKSFHLGTVGGSGHNTATLNRRREANLERTISNAVAHCQAVKDLALVEARIHAIERAPMRAAAKQNADERLTAHGSSVSSGLNPGDMVRWMVSGTDCKVIRVNKTSVTVEMCGGVERLKFNEISQGKPLLNTSPRAHPRPAET